MGPIPVPAFYSCSWGGVLLSPPNIYGLSPLEPPVTKGSFTSPDARSYELLVHQRWTRMYTWTVHRVWDNIGYTCCALTPSKDANGIKSTTNAFQLRVIHMTNWVTIQFTDLSSSSSFSFFLFFFLLCFHRSEFLESLFLFAY